MTAFIGQANTVHNFFTTFANIHMNIKIYFNSNALEWNPDDEISVGIDNGWECLPCCFMSGYSIQQCPLN